ncbi:DUF6090 family protein [Psychroserpens luteus]|uniref:DUF6090 family protein n=1 Tax=Psychroserpens luteus TaxID=1434066 RepID=A0ABW5ZZK7_9FLAO
MESKTSKYFKYAIGEIILVVIGILIALSINTWNENRINNGKLKTYITDIIKDLKKDTLNINIAIKQAEKRSRITKSFLALKDYNTLSRDSLEKSLETFYSKVVFSKSTFAKIENSGITDFGDYEDLIEIYKTYYTIAIPDIISFEGTHNRAVDIEDNYWRYEQKVYEFIYDDALSSYQNKEESKRNLILLLKSPTARNILKIDYRRNRNTIKRLYNFNNNVIKLIDKSQKELND